MNIVEFALKFKDMASGELRNFGNSARQTFTNVNAMTNNLTGHNKVLTSSYSQLQTNIRKVEETIKNSTIPSQIREARKELEALQRQSKNSMGGKALGGSGGGIGGALGLAGGLSSMIGPAAIIGAGLYVGHVIGSAVSEGLEKAHALHAAEAQLKNTMQNNGTYTPETFEKVIKSSKDLASGVKFTSMDVIGLQSQLRLVGNIGESEMIRMTKASADMATKFGTGLGEAGNAIAKAVNNPEMLRRLGMQLKIDPAIQVHLQNLAKNGHEAQARLELLSIVESKVGGAAKAAFDADPMSRFDKVVGSIKLSLGEAAVIIQKAIAPFMTSFVQGIQTILPYVTSGIQQVAGWITSITSETGGWIDYIQIVKYVFTNNILPVIQKVFGFVFNVVGYLIEFIGKSYILKDIFSTIYFIVGSIFDMVGYLISGLTWLFDNIIKPILDRIDWVYGKMTGRNQITVNHVAPKPKNKSNNEILQNTAQNSALNSSTAAGTEKAITGGGPKVVNITVQKFLDNINIHTTNFKEGEQNIESIFMEMFARVMVQGAQAQ